MQRSIVLVAHNVRSSHNVGALFRLADGLAVSQLILTGYTPYPISKSDERLPHLAKKVNSQIHKTALGAELSVSWQHDENLSEVINQLRNDGYELTGLEQVKNSIHINTYKAPDKVALFLGNEVTGLEPDTHQLFDNFIEIPMLGKKESHNVATAAAMALYRLRFD
jgi:23S rRNA (guanosine2251-2'-O)-methyltransferase